MNEKSNLEPKFGIVAMLDALGVRNATVQESADFIKDIQEIINEVPRFLATFYKEKELKQKKIESTPPQLTTFGDTFIFSWEMSPDEVSDYLPEIGFILSYVIVLGLEKKMAFRGAIAVGAYIQSGPTVLGPAIADAASWYDGAEMIGVFATPHCGQFISSINAIGDLNSMDFVEYEVQLRGNVSRKLWTVPWPELLGAAKKGKNDLQSYYKLIQRFSIPKGAEDKYFNTEKFVIHILPKK
jgi:hypothetical protein